MIAHIEVLVYLSERNRDVSAFHFNQREHKMECVCSHALVFVQFLRCSVGGLVMIRVVFCSILT